nr:putative transcriptional regulator slk2 [Quercus suber]
MALETFLDSNFQMEANSLVLTRPTGGFLGFSSSNDLPEKDEQYQAVVASLLNTSSGNLPNNMSRIAHMNVGRVSGEVNPTVLNHVVNGLSVRPSSLVTDSESALSEGPHSHRSASTNMDSYLESPISPSSFSSRNLRKTRSSVIDGSSIAQYTSHLEQDCPQVHKRKYQHEEFNNVSKVAAQVHSSLLKGTRQEPLTSTQMIKKPRLDIKQEAIMQQHIIQQLLQNPDSSKLQGHLPQLQAMFQQHQLQNQKWQKILQSIPQYQGIDMQQQQQRQMRQHLQQQMMHQVPVMHPFNEGICSRRLMQQIYHLRQRPADNDIAYWRKFVAEYYAPSARKRWCVSLYDKVGHNAFGIFPQTARDTWKCDLCGCKSGRGFEAYFEILPRLNRITFDSVIDEILFLDLPRECRFPSGLMMLEYGRAIQESVYEQLRVVREGQLRIIYTNDLKILSWEFCSRPHEELLPRTFVASQINQLVHSAQKYESNNNDSGTVGASSDGLQANCNKFLATGCHLARALELQLVDDWGFSGRYTRCLQIAEVINSMKDLMTFCQDNDIGPMESLKRYSRESTTSNFRKKELPEKVGEKSAQGLPTEKDKVMATSTAPSSNVDDSLNMTNRGHLTTSEHAASALPGPKTSSPRLIQNSPIDGLSSSHSLEGSQNIQDHTIQKILQEMVNNSRKANGNAANRVNCKISQGTVVDLPTRGRVINIVQSGLGSGNSTTTEAAPGNALSSSVGRISSSRAMFNRESSEFCGNNSFNKKREPEVPEKHLLPEAILNMIPGYHENGKFSSSSGNVCYGWKV